MARGSCWAAPPRARLTPLLTCTFVDLHLLSTSVATSAVHRLACSVGESDKECVYAAPMAPSASGTL